MPSSRDEALIPLAPPDGRRHVASTPAQTASRANRWWPALLLALAVLAWAWPIAAHPTSVPFSPGSKYSDLLVSHWPNAEYWRRSVWQWHEWPLWNRWRLAGMPFAADPLSGIWYPPNWLLLILPLPLGFNWLLLLHLAWAGWGMRRFLREIGCSEAASLLGGIAFSGAPKLIAHLAAGHVSLVQAVAWTPWLMLAVHRAATHPGWTRGAFAGALLALTFLADVRWAFYAGVLAAGYWATQGMKAWPGPSIEGKERPRSGGRIAARDETEVGSRRSEVRRSFRLPTSDFRPLTSDLHFILPPSAFILSLVVTLPLLELLGQASRARLSYADATSFSLPWTYAIGFILPDLGGFHEWMTYAGLVVLALALAALIGGGLRRKDLFWPLSAVLAWGVSLGSNTPLYRVLFDILPGVGWLRVPPRAMFVTAFCLAVLAARGADVLAGDLTGRLKRRLSLATFGGLAFALMLGAAVALASGGLPTRITGFIVLSVAITALVGLRLTGRLSGRLGLVLFGLIASIDLLWVNSSLLETRPAVPASPADPVARFLLEQPGPYRVYSPSYSLPQDLAARYGIEQVDGVNPIQLSSTVEFVGRAAGVETAGYSVPLPELGGDPASHNRNAVPDAGLLGMLNARYLVSEFEIAAPGLIGQTTIGETRVYENEFARGEAWLVHRTVHAGSSSAGLREAAQGHTAVEGGRELRGSGEAQRVDSVRVTANRVEYAVEASEPGLLVTSEVFYPGWRAWVDGAEVEVHRVNGLLRGVYVDAGAHRVEFEFRPASVYLGLAGSLLGLLGLAWAVKADR